jgi:hypothetical protein
MGHEPLNPNIFAKSDQCPGIDTRKIEQISVRELIKISRVEIFNSHTKHFEQIPVKHVLRYKEAGLTDDHLSKLVDLLKSADHTLGSDLNALYEEAIPRSPSAKGNRLFNQMKRVLKESRTIHPKKIQEISAKIKSQAETDDCIDHGDSRPFALYLRSNEGQPSRDSFLSNPDFYEKHNFCVRTFKKFSNLCEIIINYANKTISTLITSAHSNRLQGSRLTTINPDLSCLRNDLPKNATIILEGCENGWGGNKEQNLANVIANAADDGTTIIAPKTAVSETFIHSAQPWDVQYHDYYDDADVTYKIEPGIATCDQSSGFLDRCKRFILKS